jgi:TRAP-type uncharacterized transport system substrate-binding protein
MSTVIAATAEVTGASVENMGLVATGDADLALALGRHGGSRPTPAPAGSRASSFEMIRGLASMYANMVQIVALEGSGITSLEDLRRHARVGRRARVGHRGERAR